MSKGHPWLVTLYLAAGVIFPVGSLGNQPVGQPPGPQSAAFIARRPHGVQSPAPALGSESPGGLSAGRWVAVSHHLSPGARGGFLAHWSLGWHSWGWVTRERGGAGRGKNKNLLNHRRYPLAWQGRCFILPLYTCQGNVEVTSHWSKK